jgi:acyl-CoA synthetase (AMP-forming)/AMP-acid ligase II
VHVCIHVPLPQLAVRAGLEFVKAMWGCLFARVVAVPVCPPDPTRLAHTLPHFNRIVHDCGAIAILTDRTFHMVRGSLASELNLS